MARLRDHLGRAFADCDGRPWERRAASHAYVLILLAEVNDDPGLGLLLQGAADVLRDLLLAVGSAANGMIISSHRRLLGYLHAGDADSVAREIEQNLSVPHFQWRLTYLLGSSPGPG